MAAAKRPACIICVRVEGFTFLSPTSYLNPYPTISSGSPIATLPPTPITLMTTGREVPSLSQVGKVGVVTR